MNQVAMILGDAEGPISGLQKFTANKTAEQKTAILVALPEIAADLKVNASALAGLSQDVTPTTVSTENDNQSGHSEDSSKKSDSGAPKDSAATLNVPVPWMTILTVGSFAVGFGFSFTLLS